MVIDTTLFIDHLRKKNKANSQLAMLPADTVLFVSTVTIFELLMGATDKEKYNDVELLLSRMIPLPFDEKVSIKAGEIYHSLRRRNQLIEFRDIFIAATAITYDLPIKTLNQSHFKRIEGLRLL